MDNNSKPQNTKPKRRRKRYKKPSSNTPSIQADKNQKQRSKSSNDGQKSNRNTGKTTSLNLKAHEIISKYDNFMSQYLSVRKKFFEQFYKLNRHKKEKMEANYVRSLSELMRFTYKLKPWQKEVLEKRTEGYPMDTFYSTSQNLPVHGVPDQELPKDPEYHIKNSQKERHSFKEDTEQSSGTMEDYLKYQEEKQVR